MATITTSEAKNVASISKAEGRATLAILLGWPQIDEDKDMQQSIQLDFLYDTLTFAAEKGFSWDKVSCVVNFADRLLTKFKGCDKITDILGFYNTQASYLLEYLGDREFQIFSAHLFETILPHFKLYQHVFNMPRSEQVPKVQLNVNPPFDCMKLKDTKTVNVWEYEKQIEELEKRENETMREKVTEKEQRMSKLHADSASVVEKVAKTESTFDKESLGNIIEEVMRGLTLTATEKMRFDIERLQDDLEFKLEKTSVPRPQVLGPPPRYTIQSVKTPSSKGPKSPKPGSRSSMRGKKK